MIALPLDCFYLIDASCKLVQDLIRYLHSLQSQIVFFTVEYGNSSPFELPYISEDLAAVQYCLDAFILTLSNLVYYV